MNYSLLKESIRESKVTFRQISDSVQMTEAGLRKSINNETLTISVLEKICNILNVSPVIYFNNYDYHVNGSHNQVNNGIGTQVIMTSEQKEIENLKEIIGEKNKIIEEKERFIQYLLNPPKNENNSK